MRRIPGDGSRKGFTMVELLLALGLFAMLIVALVQLLDTSLGIWARTETERDLLDMGGAVLDLVAADVHAIEGGPRGDLVAQWRGFDLDGDDVPSMLWPRISLIRQASPAEWRRLADPAEDAAVGTGHGGLIEVCWSLLPDRTENSARRGVGVLWRGERRLGADGLSFFDPRFFDATNRPLPGGLEPLTGGVLWFEPRFATQTSILSSGASGERGEPRGWTLGDKLSDCASSWDAFGSDRPDAELSDWNEPGAGMPASSDYPMLPRRVRITLEIERPADQKYRTRLALELLPSSQEMMVRDEQRLPASGELVLVGDEWIEVGTRARGRVSIVRARRGTRPARHAAGELVHHGSRQEREFVVPTLREDWDL